MTKLISFEGGEGVGKTTQIALLKKHLETAGHEVVAVREPGGTRLSEKIRELVLSPEYKEIGFTTEVLLFQAARAQIYAEIVLPSLRAGQIVLMDRTRDSSVVYQGMVRGFGMEAIESLNEISTQHTTPGLTLLLDYDPEKGLQRRAQTGEQNRLDLEKLDFHRKVRDTYLELAHKDTIGRWQVIDGSKSVREVEEEIGGIVQQFLAQ